MRHISLPSTLAASTVQSSTADTAVVSTYSSSLQVTISYLPATGHSPMTLSTWNTPACNERQSLQLTRDVLARERVVLRLRCRATTLVRLFWFSLREPLFGTNQPRGGTTHGRMWIKVHKLASPTLAYSTATCTSSVTEYLVTLHRYRTMERWYQYRPDHHSAKK